MTSTPARSADDPQQTVALPAAIPAQRSGEDGGGDGPPARRFNVKRAVAVGVVAAVVLATAGFAAYVTRGDVPRGTRVLGLDLGAKSRTDAEQALRAHVADRVQAPARVRVDGKPVDLQPADIDLALDVDATVGQAIRSGTRLTGHVDVTPVVRLDQARLEVALRRAMDRTRITMRKPGITFTGVTAKPTYPQAGLDLDPAIAAVAVQTAWPTGEVADVPLTQRTPVTTKEQVDELIAGLAKPAVAAPVTVRVDGKTVPLTPAAIARGLVFRSDDAGRLTPAIDAARLRAAAKPAFAQVETAPKPARITLVSNRPTITAGTPGRMVDLATLGPALLGVLPEPAPREVTGALVDDTEGTTEADLAKLGIKERVSTFTTYFTGGRSSPRSHNIITVAKAVDGALVRPGETFSLNKHTGERTYAKGYKDAPVIVGGVLEPGVAGGASQFTTTLFNAAYYAGLEDVEHKPHSFYFSRYPSVIESTIFYPTLDLKFKNTTPYGIWIATVTTNRAVTVSMWSTKVYDSVKTEYGPRRNRTSPPTVERPAGPRCIATSGLPGFTQDAWRVIRKDGREVEREKFTWRYDPEPRFVCGGAPQSE
ncbi:MAG: VanW family protein [Actinoplanes sp.]